MIFEKIVGRFKIKTSEGFPFWTEIKTEREDCQLFGIHHDEIDDLIYGLQKAKEAIEDKQK